MLTSQGFIKFNVKKKMVPSCRLLLFHVRDDRETVADSMLVDIEDTLENKVYCSTLCYCFLVLHLCSIFFLISVKQTQCPIGVPLYSGNPLFFFFFFFWRGGGGGGELPPRL